MGKGFRGAGEGQLTLCPWGQEGQRHPGLYQNQGASVLSTGESAWAENSNTAGEGSRQRNKGSRGRSWGCPGCTRGG